MSLNEDFLEHHGVKGMKWGTRKAKAPKRQSTEAKNRDRVRAKRREHGVDALTNKEIADHNKRVGLDKSYRKLDPSTIAKGAALVGVAFALGKTMNNAVAFANSPAGKALASTIANKKTIKVAADFATTATTGKSFS